MFFLLHNPNKVCDDNFEGENAETYAVNNANSACITLGFIGGSFETRAQKNWSTKVNATNFVGFHMDDVACNSGEENFLFCPRSMSASDCVHSENVLLTCEIGEFAIIQSICLRILEIIENF